MRHDSTILNSPWLSLLLVATALLAWQGTRLVIRHAAAIGVLHAPNERSFHSDPVPHGGGLGLVLTYLLAVLLSFALGLLDARLAYCILGAGTVVAMLGLWDDIHPLPARTRLAVQAVAALAAIALCGQGLPSILPAPMWVSYSIATVALVWWINLFNFMDGIDSIAATECLFITFSATLLLTLAPGSDTSEPRLLLLLLAAAATGFLCLNWPPARVFMGDVGSTFIGYVLGVIALATVASGQLSLETWLILGGVFWIDSSVTLLRRMLNAEHWHMAHRSHAYQRYAAALGKRYHAQGLSFVQARAAAHRGTVLGVLGLNLLWLLPMAALVIIEPNWRLLWLILAWLPLIVLTLLSGKYE
jgi:Fuc2NAc and GlcNAc transferase